MIATARTASTIGGYDVAASYGYPAGMSVKSINTVIVPPVPD